VWSIMWIEEDGDNDMDGCNRYAQMTLDTTNFLLEQFMPEPRLELSCSTRSCCD
jgi:hypothetical protein